MRNYLSLFLSFFLVFSLYGQNNPDPFRQLSSELPTPNEYRTASGAPGHQYWQTRADYKMNLTLNDAEKKIEGDETITYHNLSPDPLTFLWLQLDQNVRAKDSDSHVIGTQSINTNRGVSTRQLARLSPEFDGGFKINSVTDQSGKNLKYTINKTMMRIDLPGTLAAGEKFTFNIKWWYNINNTREIGGRSGYEEFSDGHRVYCIAQFFPRLCSYNDLEGWQNKQFLGRGEFALIFGDYDVSISVPEDHLVAASGELQNVKAVLSPEHRKRWNNAKESLVQPVTIQTLEEAQENSKDESTKYKTW